MSGYKTKIELFYFSNYPNEKPRLDLNGAVENFMNCF